MGGAGVILSHELRGAGQQVIGRWTWPGPPSHYRPDMILYHACDCSVCVCVCVCAVSCALSGDANFYYCPAINTHIYPADAPAAVWLSVRIFIFAGATKNNLHKVNVVKVTSTLSFGKSPLEFWCVLRSVWLVTCHFWAVCCDSSRDFV